MQIAFQIANRERAAQQGRCGQLTVLQSRLLPHVAAIIQRKRADDAILIRCVGKAVIQGHAADAGEILGPQRTAAGRNLKADDTPLISHRAKKISRDARRADDVGQAFQVAGATRRCHGAFPLHVAAVRRNCHQLATGQARDDEAFSQNHLRHAAQGQ
ncbi:hypothetical protein D3C87_1468180 [compost metagenome]